MRLSFAATGFGDSTSALAGFTSAGLGWYTAVDWTVGDGVAKAASVYVTPTRTSPKGKALIAKGWELHPEGWWWLPKCSPLQEGRRYSYLQAVREQARLDARKAKAVPRG